MGRVEEWLARDRLPLRQRIAFASASNPRVLRAAAALQRDGFLRPILVGRRAEIQAACAECDIEPPLEVLDVDESRERFAAHYQEIRRARGMTYDEAYQALANPLLAAMILAFEKRCDGVVGGPGASTAEVASAAQEIIGLRADAKRVSGCHLIFVDVPGSSERVLVFADAVVDTEPTPVCLAEIAIETAGTAAALTGVPPRVAFLSFSTIGSAQDARVERVREAVRIARARTPDLVLDGELQVDAALVPGIAARKAPQSPIAGDANVLVFPDADSADIGRRLVLTLGRARCVGTLLQGLARPASALPDGCTDEDAIRLALVTGRLKAEAGVAPKFLPIERGG